MISVRQDIKCDRNNGIFHYLNDASITESDKKEFKAYDNYDKSRVSDNFADDSYLLLDDIVLKSNFIKTFDRLISRLELSGTETILEMGGGYCWASVILKRNYPNCYVVGSDLVPSTLEHTIKYEKILQTNIDEKWAFNCRDIPFKENQFDRIFTFAAFHHFGEQGDYSKAIKEMVRILKPKGRILLLYEPSSPPYLYKQAFDRVNVRAHEDGVDEDVLLLSKIEKYATDFDCKFTAEFFPFYMYREGIPETIYYYVLTKIPLLQKLVPCSVNIVIEKNERANIL